MKRRIEQLLNGKFEYERPALNLMPDQLSITVQPGEVVKGSFAVESAAQQKTRGFLYSSSPRVTCDPVEFQGIHNEIHYQIDGNGLTAGMEEQGCFTICSELGEYTLPFLLRTKTEESERHISSQAADSTELAALAQKDYQSAYRCFITRDFQTALEKNEPELLAWYDGLSLPSFDYQSLEEFLISAGKKEPVQILADRSEITLTGLLEPVAEKVVLTRSEWGFQKITVESDARFLRPEKKMILTDEFAGSTFDLNLVIDTNLMHRGKNFGRVTLQTSSQKVIIEVTASGDVRSEKEKQNHICKIMTKKLEGLYVSFRLKKIDLQTWVERSINVLNSYRRAGGTDVYADLFLVQLYFADGKKQKAIKLLESVDAQKERLTTPERYGFYLYLTTFFYQEASYVDQVEAEIRGLFYRDKTNWKLLWILLYLQETYLQDETAKYEAVSEQFRYGCRSRILYLEAFQILKKNPFLMRHIGSFELSLLRFAVKEKVITAEIIRQVCNLTVHYGKYSARLYEILTAGYEMYPSTDLVKSICLLQMKGERRDAQAFWWYAKGVEEGLRITGLYEYYMESTKQRDLQEMPQIIRMYFAYDTTLDYRKRAAIYSHMIEKKESDAQVYRTYRASMEKFALDQLDAGRITDELVTVYQNLLRRSMLNRGMAEHLAKMLFTYEITCSSQEMRSVIVHSEWMIREQAAVFSNGTAQIAIYDPDSVLLVEDSFGNRSAAEQFCTKRKLFDNEEMLKWCMELVPEYTGIVLFLCSACRREAVVNHNTLPYLQTGCEMEEFTDAFRSILRREVLHYYLENPREDSLQEFLEKIPYLDYVKEDKSALITLLAEEGMCNDAFSLLDMYGAEGIPLLQLVRICSRMVLDLEFGENTMLLSLCFYCFFSGKYDDKLLRYLLLYYEGPVREMKSVWEAARKFDLDTMLLEEKILMMLLFTRSETKGSEPVFESYEKKMGRRRLCTAYVNLKAYEYFVKGFPVADCVFHYIEKEYAYLQTADRLSEQEEVCRLALLQYYAKKVELTAQQSSCVKELLEEFSTKGMRFAFWKRLDASYLRPYEMDGKVFAEYVCNPASSVRIYYRTIGKGQDYQSEMMKNCFEGIFVKEFTLFYGDEMECYLEEEKDGEIKKSGKRILSFHGEITEGSTQYELLNRISKKEKQSDLASVEKELENYLLLEHLAKELFTLV